MLNKSNLRKNYLAKRLKLEAEEVLNETIKIVHKVKALREFKQSRFPVAYWPIHNEPNLIDLYHDFAKDKKHLIFLRIEGNKMIPHEVKHPDELEEKPPYGIPQPSKNFPVIDADKIDLIFVPGLVFDKRGHRIGFGKGYYDRFLKKTKAIKLGIGFDFQLMDKVPEDEHDVPLDILITPSKTYRISSRTE